MKVINLASQIWWIERKEIGREWNGCMNEIGEIDVGRMTQQKEDLASLLASHVLFKIDRVLCPLSTKVPTKTIPYLKIKY